MNEFLIGHYSYWLTTALFCLGLYGILIKKNLVKKLIGLSILQASIIQFWVSVASKWGGTVPVRTTDIPNEVVANYLNPLPHTLMLTAIVVGVATMGVAFTLLITIWNRYKSLSEEEILTQIQQ